jgi:hypothetical protein
MTLFNGYFLLPMILALVSPGLGGQPAAEPKDAAGHYEGAAKSKQAGDLKVSLNLHFVNGKYEGALVTPVGTFALTGASFQAGRLKAQFNAGDSQGSFDGRLEQGLLDGTFKFGDDTGSITLHRVGEPKPLTSSAPTLNLNTQQWREDLQFLARELAKRHGNAFHYVSRDRFDAAVAELDRRLDRLNGDEMYVALDRIANLIGDGHTYVGFPPDRANLPIDLKRFGDQYRVVSVGAGLEKALGARVLKVQDVPIARARELLLTMTPQDETAVLRDARVENFLTMGIVLHGYGIIPDRNSARFTLADDDGHEFDIELHAVSPHANSRWVHAYKEPPLFRTKPSEGFWYASLPAARSVYCNFRSYRNLATHASGLLKLVDEQHPDKLVIDLRQNGGGDYFEGLKHLVEPIRKRAAINRKGHLFVLIGPHTFSAAMSNAGHFRARTAAMLVGEPIGEKPNSWQEGREMRLPNSHLKVNYSILFYRFVQSGENMIRPNKEIAPTWSEYKAGRDPVLDWVLKYETK